MDKIKKGSEMFFIGFVIGVASIFGLWIIYYKHFDSLIHDAKEEREHWQWLADREQLRYQWYSDRKYND